MTTYNSERDVKRKVKTLLTKHNYFWWMPAANGFGTSGVSDILAIRSGVFLAIETKFGGNKPTAMQKGFLNSIMKEDGFAFVVDEKNIDWFESWLQAFDRAMKTQKPSHEDGALMLNAIKAMTEAIV